MKVLANLDRKRIIGGTLGMLIALLLSACDSGTTPNEGRIVKGLPWQVETFEDGSSEVFGLRLGHTSLAEALKIVGKESDSAIVIDQQNRASLESYISHFKAGPLQGKLVLLVDIPASQLQAMIQNLEHGGYMASGARKLLPTEQDWQVAQQASISGISFIPAINLDEEIITKRFGAAQSRLDADKVSHFLYPDKGLDIALSEEGKEVLQYIAPRQFHKLSQPLLNNPDLKLAPKATP